MDKAKEAIVQKLKASGCRITKQRLMLLDIYWKKTVPVAKKSITAHLGSIQASEQQPYTG